MRVCIVVNNFPSLSEPFLVNKIAGLATRGHKVHIVCSHFKGIEDIFLRYNLSSSNIVIHQLHLKRGFSNFLVNIVRQPSLFFKSVSIDRTSFRRNYERHYCISFFRRIKYDIIHFEFSSIGTGFASIIKDLKGKKVVSCRGGMERLKLQNSDKSERLTRLLNKIDMIHCVSDDVKKIIEPHCNNPSIIFIGHPSVDINAYHLSSRNEQKEVFEILSISRSYKREFTIALLTIKGLVDKGYRVHWNVVTGSDHNEDLLSAISDMGLASHVTVLGKRDADEVKGFSEKANIFLAANEFDGMSTAILEAMAMQLPVVAMECGGIREMVEHGVSGFIVPLNSHEQLAQSVAALIDDAGLRRQTGLAARQTIAEAFTIQKETDTFEKAYRSLL